MALTLTAEDEARIRIIARQEAGKFTGIAVDDDGLTPVDRYNAIQQAQQNMTPAERSAAMNS